MSCEVKDGVNFVALKTVHDLRRVGDVAMVEAKVSLVIEGSGVVQRGAIVELVERHNVVGVRICHG